MEIVVWFEQSGESPQVPYFNRRWRERRMVRVPSHLLEDTPPPMSIESDAGSTDDPF